jgi:hypothetical protein
MQGGGRLLNHSLVGVPLHRRSVSEVAAVQQGVLARPGVGDSIHALGRCGVLESTFLANAM